MARRWLWGLWVVCVCIVSAQADDLSWRDPAAAERLLVMAGDDTRTRLLVELPADWQTRYADASVYRANGQTVPRRLLRAGDRLLAVEIAVPEDLRRASATLPGMLTRLEPTELWTRFGLQVYLRRETGADVPEAPPGNALALYTRRESIKARPSTAEEFRTYFSRSPLAPFTAEWSVVPTHQTETFVDKPEAEEPPRNGANRRRGRRKDPYEALRYAVTGTIVVDTAGDWQIEVNRGSTGPWFVEIDGRPVLSWGTPDTITETALVSAPIRLEPGLHSIVFGGAIDEDQDFPTLAVRVDGAEKATPLAAAQLATDATPMALAVDARDALTAPGLALRPMHVWRLAETGSTIVQARHMDLSRNQFDRAIVARSLAAAGTRAITLDATGDVLLPQSAGPLTYTVEDAQGYTPSLQIPQRDTWLTAQRLEVEFTITHTPILEPRDGQLHLPYRVAMEKVSTIRGPQHVSASEKEAIAQMMARLTIRVTRFDRDGKARDSELVPVPAADYRRAVNVSVKDTSIAAVTLQPMLDLVPMGRPRRIQLIDPSDLATLEEPLGVRAAFLSSGNTHITLRRRARIAWTGHSPELPLARALLVDSFVATSRHPTDDLAPSDWFANTRGVSVTYQALNSDALQRQRSGLDKFAHLEQARRADVDAVIWLTGPEDITAGMDVVDYTDTMAFLAESTLAADRLPILATPPVQGKLTRAHLRPYALAIKELGAKYQIPVVDLYSLSLLTDSLDPYYQLDDAGVHRSATPNAAGRSWFFQHVLRTIAHHNHLHRVQD